MLPGRVHSVAGATLKNDFIEIFNPGAQPVNVTGWTVQVHYPGQQLGHGVRLTTSSYWLHYDDEG